jgi:cbb3-type cytochrome oxidase maturation protein
VAGGAGDVVLVAAGDWQFLPPEVARMTPILWLIGLSLLLGGGALALFLWARGNGQYEDMDGAAQRILFDDDRK